MEVVFGSRGAVARQAHDSADQYRRVIRKIISYMNGARKLGLVLSKGGDLKLLQHVDADYVGEANSRPWMSCIAEMPIALRKTA